MAANLADAQKRREELLQLEDERREEMFRQSLVYASELEEKENKKRQPQGVPAKKMPAKKGEAIVKEDNSLHRLNTHTLYDLLQGRYKTSHTSHVKHLRKRILVTYVYLLLVWDLHNPDYKFPGIQNSVRIPAPIQQGSGGGTQQAAHQLLASIMIGGCHLWDLKFHDAENIIYSQPPGKAHDKINASSFNDDRVLAFRRAFVYLSAVTSIIDKNYNFADNFIEDNGRPIFDVVLNKIKQNLITSKKDLYDIVVDMFNVACQYSLADILIRRDADIRSAKKKTISEFHKSPEAGVFREEDMLKKMKFPAREAEIRNRYNEIIKLLLLYVNKDIPNMRAEASKYTGIHVNKWLRKLSSLYGS